MWKVVVRKWSEVGGWEWIVQDVCNGVGFVYCIVVVLCIFYFVLFMLVSSICSCVVLGMVKFCVVLLKMIYVVVCVGRWCCIVVVSVVSVVLGQLLQYMWGELCQCQQVGVGVLLGMVDCGCMIGLIVVCVILCCCSNVLVCGLNQLV